MASHCVLLTVLFGNGRRKAEGQRVSILKADAKVRPEGIVRTLQEGVNRQVVIESYASYDYQKKRNGESLPNFETWNWSRADAIDEELHRAGLKTGIPAGYLLWNIVEIAIPDFRECAVVGGIFACQVHRQLGLIEQNGGLVNWEEKLFQHLGNRQAPSWYYHIKRGEVLADSAPFLLRPSVFCERPSRWYVEDGSGRAVTFVANANAFSPLEAVATGFVGTVPDPSSTFMRTHFSELLR